MAHVEVLFDANRQGVAIAVENWGAGQKITVTASADRSSAFSGCGSVEVCNGTDKNVWVRTDDGTAADNGQSRRLSPDERWIGALQSTDGTISLLGEASNTGSVYVMGLKGSR
jgi:hypothetical protein